ncbi:hypothetical protein [Roseimaritima ulvae]|uniref:Uncharacterized protein n=1 Tax=Roseimaritima ulvae TaxID=980254 RepID=A0A5B9QRB1_9BACT|nr:hypothetical protein [Roseimaritima ulvae]QEG39586.1 hypothetical protein UC8_15820 [Roseimaritima ulvae]
MPKIELDALDTLPGPLHQAITNAPLPPLGDEDVDAPLAAYLAEFPQLGLADTITEDAIALCTSGLWLLAGDLDRSHTISQDLGCAEGSFWHGIMHRREGDYGNAKYWFRRVGSHPVFEHIGALTGELPPTLRTGDALDPFAFVDAVQQATAGLPGADQCRDLQWLEWQCLFAACLGK